MHNVHLALTAKAQHALGVNTLTYKARLALAANARYDLSVVKQEGCDNEKEPFRRIDRFKRRGTKCC